MPSEAQQSEQSMLEKEPKTREDPLDLYPKYWTGMPAVAYEAFQIDCQGKAPSVEEMQHQMRTIFEREGVVMLTNTGLTTLEGMSPYVQAMIDEDIRYDGGANPRKPIEKNVYDVGAPGSAHLHYHHEMAYVHDSVGRLAFACDQATEGKGWTFISESLKVQDELMNTPLGQKLKEKGVCYIRKLPDKVAYQGDGSKIYNFWQDAFFTEDPEVAEKAARANGLDVEWGSDHFGHDRFMITKNYCSAFEYCPRLDRNVLYSSCADHHIWFDTWPGVMEQKPRHRPLWMTFGDDTEFTHEEWKQWIGLYDKYGVGVPWKVGDIVVLCNYQWAHGRPGYTLEAGETRRLGVTLANPFRRVGDLPDKW